MIGRLKGKEKSEAYYSTDGRPRNEKFRYMTKKKKNSYPESVRYTER